MWSGKPDAAANRVEAVGMAAKARSSLSPYARIAVVALIEGEHGWLLVRLPDELAPVYTGRAAPEGGLWAPPGGRLEEGEGLEDALHREMHEELKIRVETAGACFAYLTFHKGERLLAATMACRLSPGQAQGRPGLRGGNLSGQGDAGQAEFVLDGLEAVDARWFHLDGWLRLSAEGRTPWRHEDIVRATRLAREAWRVSEMGGSGDA